MRSNFSTLDQLVRVAVQTKFFTEGWGKPENLSRLFHLRQLVINKDRCNSLVEKDYPITIDKKEDAGHFEIFDGHFKSPFASHFPEFAPPPIDNAKFQMILPKVWKHAHLRPMCIQLAGTGDHFFWRRRVLMAKPLAKENSIGSILLENPFYGVRKPQYQRRSSLCNVTDLFIMGGCLIMESMALLDWCEKQGFGPLALTGISMGGHMCSLAACNYSKPVSLIPCLSWSTASGVFTEGVMSSGVDWNLLQSQYFSKEFQENESFTALRGPGKATTDAFKLGRDLVQKYADKEDLVHAVTTTTTPKDFEKKFVDKIKPIFENLSFKHFSKHATKVEVIEFMRGVLDEFTHLAYFAKPVDPSLIIVVTASNDAYVPRYGTVGLAELWPEAEIRFLKDKGHIGAFLFNRSEFRKAVVDALERNANKYYNNESIL